MRGNKCRPWKARVAEARDGFLARRRKVKEHLPVSEKTSRWRERHLTNETWCRLNYVDEIKRI